MTANSELAVRSAVTTTITQWNDADMQLLADSICKGATPTELSLFAKVCQKTGLDPFAKQIYAMKRWDNTLKREAITFQTGIDGLRLLGQRSGDMDGQEGPFWCGVDGVWHDVWMFDEPPVAAKVIIHRKGHSHPYVGIAKYNSYVQLTRDKVPNSMWEKMPDNQLAKCAEALALRKAFPAELSGLYTSDEMGQADAPEPSQSRPVVSDIRPALSPAGFDVVRFLSGWDATVLGRSGTVTAGRAVLSGACKKRDVGCPLLKVNGTKPMDAAFSSEIQAALESGRFDKLIIPAPAKPAPVAPPATPETIQEQQEPSPEELSGAAAVPPINNFADFFNAAWDVVAELDMDAAVFDGGIRKRLAAIGKTAETISLPTLRAWYTQIQAQTFEFPL